MISARLIALLAVSAVLATAPARALSPDAAAAALAQRFGVKILRVTPVEHDGKRLYSVVVMNPGGNFNEAFKVTTLVVEAETGDLVAQFRPQNTGYDLPAAANRELPGDESGAVIRRESFRGR
jgi:hypothetical protein